MQVSGQRDITQLAFEQFLYCDLCEIGLSQLPEQIIQSSQTLCSAPDSKKFRQSEENFFLETGFVLQVKWALDISKSNYSQLQKLHNGEEASITKGDEQHESDDSDDDSEMKTRYSRSSRGGRRGGGASKSASWSSKNSKFGGFEGEGNGNWDEWQWGRYNTRTLLLVLTDGVHHVRALEVRPWVPCLPPGDAAFEVLESGAKVRLTGRVEVPPPPSNALPTGDPQSPLAASAHLFTLLPTSENLEVLGGCVERLEQNYTLRSLFKQNLYPFLTILCPL